MFNLNRVVVNRCVLCSAALKNGNTRFYRTSRVLRASLSKDNATQADRQLRKNELGIQMIPEVYQRQLFGDAADGLPNISATKTRRFYGGRDERAQDGVMALKSYTTPSATNLCLVKAHLSKHGFWNSRQDKPAFDIDYTPDVFLEIPSLKGKNVEEHFINLGHEYSSSYKTHADAFVRQAMPAMPKLWDRRSGWTRYETSVDGDVINATQVPFPTEELLVYDVEVCMREGNFPTMATAVSSDAWYSWCSDKLLNPEQSIHEPSLKPSLKDLIPFGPSSKERLIVGHNVSFDRSFIREQYMLRTDKMRFLDTMSIHISISGLTGYQRALSYSYKAAKRRGVNEGIINEHFRERNQPNPINWEDHGAANNLVDVYDFYCKDEGNYEKMSKDARDTFIKGTLEDVRGDFQDLMTYCAKDVLATSNVFRKQWPHFLERFPHPVTLAGMLEMSVMYLPCDQTVWDRYTDDSQSVYDDMERELSKSLIHLANEACALIENDDHKKDPWLWDLDWSVQDLRFRSNTKDVLVDEEKISKKRKPKKQTDTSLTPFVQEVLKSEKSLNKVQPLLPGYPLWFREFCAHPFGAARNKSSETVDKSWEPGPYLISTQMRTVPKLMRMVWDGYALHHDIKHGWGFLVPIADFPKGSTENTSEFPYDEYVKIAKPERFEDSEEECAPDFGSQEFYLVTNDTRENVLTATTVPKEKIAEKVFDGEYCPDVEVFGCRFYKLPHKDGPENRVGNPLGKDFLRFVDEGRLTAHGSDIANKVLSLSKALSYWKMNSKRVYSQMIVRRDENSSQAAILPRVVVAGTVTRRAVEPTWLTASNAYKDRVGSELKSMIQAPKGYKFVGADVDSQELWIASLLGDSHFAKIHGCTGIGWMTLQGTKADGTDMHSKTASLVSIDRNEAKVLNYGRIYGAGKAFAARFLKQSNPSLTDHQARKKAYDIYKSTKGIKSGRQWKDGTESHMFNKLEEIARSSHPATPVLRCRISRALEAESVRDEFVTSLVNWVVQSSAVDYLHLMLVSMKWLFDEFKIDGRFAISIHDEVRYIVREDQVYDAALALQITNLLTRGIFCYKMGIKDLPQSVAFFSSIDVDSVLRKEVDLDCRTPSNPNGLELGYGVPPGQSLNIQDLVKILQRRSEARC